MLSDNYRLKPKMERKVDSFLGYFSHFKVRLNQKFPFYKEKGKRGGPVE